MFESKIAERAWRDLDHSLRALVEAMPVALWSLDMQGRVTLSEGHILARNCPPQEILGQTVEALFPGNEPVLTAIQRALQGETGQQVLQFGERFYDTHFAPIVDSTGTQVGVAGASYDVTEAHRAHEALQESESRWARIAGNLPGLLYRFVRTRRGQMRFEYLSPGCRELFGLAPEDVGDSIEPLWQLVAPEDRDAFKASVLQSGRNLEPWSQQFRVQRADGFHTLQAQSRPHRRSNGTIVWDGLVLDVTESRRVQQLLDASRRALDEVQHLARLGSYRWNIQSGEVSWSDEMFRLHGYAPGEVAPNIEMVRRLIHPDDREHIHECGLEAMRLNQTVPARYRVVRPDGIERILETYLTCEADDRGQPVSLVGSAQDITERVQAETALRQSEERYALAAQGANDGLWDWDLGRNTIYFSPRWKAMSGYGANEFVDEPQAWLERVHPDDSEHLRANLDFHLRGNTAHFECEYRLRHADGTYRWMLGRGLAVVDESGQAHRIAGSQTDISRRKHDEATLARHAYYDSLTGLPNRALFLERLEHTLARAKRQPEYLFATLFLDLDRFKKINDSLGHYSGDQLLVEAARRFDKCLRPGDTVARLGGDEFAILLDDLHTLADAQEVAARIEHELEQPFQLDGREVFVTVSIGIAPSTNADTVAEELLRQADTAMYRAKGMGRARHEIFDSSMHQRAVKMLELETDLWHALERDELRLHYQPIICLSTGTICGFEALVRWQHPQRGLVSPGDFIPLAEETGLIVPIGWWVLREACRQAQAWNKTRNLWMSVNLSSKQFSQNDMIERVQKILDETGFDPRGLKLEITESVIMENTESASSMLRHLKSLGIQLSMDDFGTGYSSLSYLHRFPLDTLKIDRSFVSQMKPHARNGEIVGTILNLANGLSMNVIAEGVETEEQLYGLRKLDCDYAQGFFFARPLAPGNVEELLAQSPKW